MPSVIVFLVKDSSKYLILLFPAMVTWLPTNKNNRMESIAHGNQTDAVIDCCATVTGGNSFH